MAPTHSPLALNPAIMTIPAPTSGLPPFQGRSTPQPTQLLSASKIQRINVWRTEIGISELVCVCSLRTASSSSMSLARSPSMMHSRPGSIPLATTISGQSQPQRSPVSSVYSSSDIYSSTQATSPPLSSNSLGLMLDWKLGLCPQCGARRNDPPCHADSEAGVFESESEFTPKQPTNHTSREKLWASIKRLARKCTGRESSQQTLAGTEVTNTMEKPVDRGRGGRNCHDVSRRLSKIGIYGPVGVPTTVITTKGRPNSSPPKEIIERGEGGGGGPNMGKRISQTFKRMSIHLGSPLQSSLPPDYSTTAGAPLTSRASADGARSVAISAATAAGAGGGTGTQMYSSLRNATADDDRLMEILGPAKIVSAAAEAAAAGGGGGVVTNDQLGQQENESLEMIRLRERTQRLEKTRRLHAKTGGVAASKRPISFAGVAGGITLGARF